MAAPPGWLTTTINAKVRVRLTPAGFRVYERYMAELGAAAGFRAKTEIALIPTVDADGWYKIPLWEFANIFGPALFNGAELPFETEIQLHIGP